MGVIGTGKIGRVFARIMTGFGCELIGYDKITEPGIRSDGRTLCAGAELAARSDIVSLHCPLTPETHYLVDANALALAKPGAILINTSRGGLVDTEAVIAALKSGQLGALGIDVYEQETELFFQDLSSTIIPDDLIQRLVSFPNVIVTGHQAFFTREAIGTICATTISSLRQEPRQCQFDAQRVLQHFNARRAPVGRARASGIATCLPPKSPAPLRSSLPDDRRCGRSPL